MVQHSSQSTPTVTFTTPPSNSKRDTTSYITATVIVTAPTVTKTIEANSNIVQRDAQRRCGAGCGKMMDRCLSRSNWDEGFCHGYICSINSASVSPVPSHSKRTYTDVHTIQCGACAACNTAAKRDVPIPTCGYTCTDTCAPTCDTDVPAAGAIFIASTSSALSITLPTGECETWTCSTSGCSCAPPDVSAAASPYCEEVCDVEGKSCALVCSEKDVSAEVEEFLAAKTCRKICDITGHRCKVYCWGH